MKNMFMLSNHHVQNDGGIKFLRMKERERHHSLLEHNPDAIFLIDLQGYILYMNPMANQLIGYLDHHSAKTSFLSFVVAKDRDKMERLFNKTCTGQAQLAECTIQKRSGEYVECRVNTVPIIIEERTEEIYIVVHDITKHKRAAEELRKTQLELQTILENQGGFTFKFKEIDGKFIHTFCAGMGISPEEVVGKELADFLPEEIAEWKENFYRRAWEGDHVFYEGRNKGMDYFAALKPIKKDGKVVEVIASCIDITEQKRMEEALKESETKYRLLAEQLEEERIRTGELMLMSEKLSVISQLAAGVAHEIRNPLAALKGFAQLLQAEHGADSRYIQIMLDEIDRINSIVNEFMGLAKPRSTQFEHTDLVILVQQVITLLNTQAIMNGVHISCTFSPNLPMVYCDQHQLKQVFINLLKNAIEAMPDGGPIMVNVKRRGKNQVAVIFKDRGIGISEERLTRLAEPFYSTKEKGTGLGMMVSYKIIEEHHGKINIYSKENEGTMVEVILPIERINSDS